MKFLVSADDTGAAKEVVCVRGTDTSKQDGVQPKSITNYLTEPTIGLESRVVHLLNYNSQYIISSRLDGNISIFEIPDDEITEVDDKYKMLKNFKIDIEVGDRPIALQKIEKLDSVIVAYESCRVFLIPIIDSFNIEPIEIELPQGLKKLHAFTINSQYENIFAIGGQEQDLKVIKFFDLKFNSTIFKKKDYKSKFTTEVLFQAKNVKNDHLDMRVPIWITNILFLDQEEPSNFNIITSTRYGQIRIYETKHGRKPTKDYKVCEKAILKMVFCNDDKNELIITDTHNLIGKYSLKKIDENGYKLHSASAGDIYLSTPKLLGKYTGGNTGATFGIQVYEGILAVAGLDRYLRVFDLESREILAKVYLGVEISSLTVLDDEDIDEESNKRKREEEEDDEEMWNQLKKK